MRLGIADHFGLGGRRDRARRPQGGRPAPDRPGRTGVCPAPIHYESSRLDLAATAELVAEVRSSVVRATASAFDDLSAADAVPIGSIFLRALPADFPDDIAVQRRTPYEARADVVMYRTLLAEVARGRGWDVRSYDAKRVEARRPTGWVTGPTRRSAARGRRSGRPGRRTIASHSRRRSWVTERATCRPVAPVSGGVSRDGPRGVPCGAGGGA